MAFHMADIYSCSFLLFFPSPSWWNICMLHIDWVPQIYKSSYPSAAMKISLVLFYSTCIRGGLVPWLYM